MSDRVYATDVVVVGSGGGLCGAVTAACNGLETLVIEKEPLLGGSTAMSGGILWLPNNPLMQAEGVADSFEDAMTYFDSVVGDVGPASSEARRTAFILEGANMVRFLQGLGMTFARCEGYSDYYAGMRGIRGDKPRGRSIEPLPFNGKELGPWLDKLRPGIASRLGVAVMTREVAMLNLIKRTPKAWKVAARVATRTALGRAKGEAVLTNGSALIGQTLKIALEKEVSIWTSTGLVDLLVEDGRVVGVVASRDGRTVEIRASRGVLLSSGGFARNAAMRKEYSRQPNEAQWTSANPGDTGEVMQAAMRHGASVDLMDEAFWIPSSVRPDGTPAMHTGERSKPHSIMVNARGQRYFNEAVSYMEAGRQMYAQDAVPSWLVMDSQYFSRYLFSFKTRLQPEWISSGYMKQGDTIDDLARQSGIDPAGLTATIERFNTYAREGTDPDFHRGEGAYEAYQGDITNRPNPALGPIEKPPYYAVALYPGDVGTSGGLLADEYARVLDQDHQPIPGLYAAGNCSASVMGRAYPGAGASIAASYVFSHIAVKHIASEPGAGSG